MKFVSLILLLLALTFSWSAYKDTADVPVAIHYQLQVDLQHFIIDYIRQNAPQVSNLTFYQFYTEPEEHGRVRAIFEYSFDSTDDKQETTTSRLTGYATLAPEGENQDQWTVETIEIADQVITFQKGTLISPATNP